MKNSYSEMFRWCAQGVDIDNRLVRRWFSSRISAERWAGANLVELWGIYKE